MTRLDRLLLHVPRLRSLVLERDAFVGHCVRLQGELAESLERERVLRKELEVAGYEAGALLDHGSRLQREQAESLDRERALLAKLAETEEEVTTLLGHCARLRSEVAGNLERERTLRKELDVARGESTAFLDHGARLQRELAENLAREQVLWKEIEAAGYETTARKRARAGTLHTLRQDAGVPMPGELICAKMREDWDGRVRSQGLYFIATGQPDWTDESFFRSGEENVREHILSDLENICRGKDPKQMRLVEIGCGVGRLTRALAAIFGEVHAVDISPEMIRLAREKLGGLPNVHLHVNNGSDLSMLPDGAFDFAFSFIVFQHIPDQAIIENYVRETHRVLEPGALFKFQVEGGPTVQRARDDTWHGVSFAEEELRDLARRTGFELRYVEGAGTQYFWAWFFKP